MTNLHEIIVVVSSVSSFLVCWLLYTLLSRLDMYFASLFLSCYTFSLGYLSKYYTYNKVLILRRNFAKYPARRMTIVDYELQHLSPEGWLRSENQLLPEKWPTAIGEQDVTGEPTAATGGLNATGEPTAATSEPTWKQFGNPSLVGGKF